MRLYQADRRLDAVAIACSIAPAEADGERYELDLREILVPLQRGGLARRSAVMVANQLRARAARSCERRDGTMGRFLSAPGTYFGSSQCMACLTFWGCHAIDPNEPDGELLWRPDGGVIVGTRPADSGDRPVTPSWGSRLSCVPKVVARP